MCLSSILCWGDSNTYGYDPRGFWGGRYDADHRWCDLLSRRTGVPVLNCGENGRTVPLEEWDDQQLADALSRHAPIGLLILMLGTNDVLTGRDDTLPQRMRRMTALAAAASPKTPVLLVSPPPAAASMPELCRRLRTVDRLCQTLAEEQGLLFCPANRWPLSLAYDGIHLSEEGHRQFADRMYAYLNETGFCTT